MSRVVVIATCAAAVVVVAAAGLLGERLVLSREETRLVDAARTLAHELASAPPTTALGHIADEEAAEIAHTGLRIALFRDGVFEGGDRRAGEQGVRRDMTIDRKMTIVVSAPVDPRVEFRRSFYPAAGIALGIVCVLGVIAGTLLARWAVRPLVTLTSTLTGVGTHGEGQKGLEAPIDCAEVELLRTALKDALFRVEEALAHARRFAADAAHELRTPLTSLRTELELALEETRSSESLVRANATVTRLSETLDRLLLLAAPAESVSAREAVALSDVGAEVVARLEASRAARVELRLRADGTVRGDPTLLGMLVGNAVDNALKYAPTGAVVVVVDESESETTLDVVDEGPGIATTERETSGAPSIARPEPPTSVGRGLASRSSRTSRRCIVGRRASSIASEARISVSRCRVHPRSVKDRVATDASDGVRHDLRT